MLFLTRGGGGGGGGGCTVVKRKEIPRSVFFGVSRSHFVCGRRGNGSNDKGKKYA